MNTCICCHNALLRHIRNHQAYWFCAHCHQEMPSHELDASGHFFKAQVKDLAQVLEAIPF